MTEPSSSGENASSCTASGIYEATARGCKVTDIIAGWICAMVSQVGILTANWILKNEAKFAGSRRTTWELINWRKWDDNFRNTSTMLRAFLGDRVTSVFRMASLAGR